MHVRAATLRSKGRGTSIAHIGSVLVLGSALLIAGPEPARAGVEELPPPGEGCLDSVAGAVGLSFDTQTPAGGTNLDVPGPVVQVIVEWMGRDDADTGASDLEVTVTGPEGVLADPAVPGTLASSDNTRIDGGGENIYAWWADITDLFGPGDPGAYNVSIEPFATHGVGTAYGATVTVVYDTTPCAEISQIIWKIGADYYFGGGGGSSPTTDLIVYDFDEPLAEDFLATVRSSHGGADSTAGTCRVSVVWMAIGTGPAPGVDDDLVAPDGTPIFPGAVEAVIDPFKPGPQPCPVEFNEPVVGLRGGDVGPEYALIEMDVLIPAGSEWMAFQLESPQDNHGFVGSPESGAWGGGGLLVLPAGQVQVGPAIALEKTVFSGHGVTCPGVEGTDELIVEGPGAPITYCFRVTNTGDVPLFPVTIDDPDLGITNEDMVLVSGVDSVPLQPGDSLVYAHETTVDGDLLNVAVATGVPPEGDPVSDDNDAEVQELGPGIALEKTVLAGHNATCPGEDGVDEVVNGVVGSPVTYCFEVTNTGSIPLFPVTIDDPDLGITNEDMVLVSGDDTVPLQPGDSLVYAYETTITANLVNVATATGVPPGGDPVSDDDDAEVVIALAVTVAALCDNDTPWLAYDIRADGVSNEATITFADGGETYSVTVAVGAGRVLWPGAVLDVGGDPIDWPGWDQDANGVWFLNPENPFAWARGDVEVTVEVNPTFGPVVLEYPPAQPLCSAQPPTRPPPGPPPTLPATGSTAPAGQALYGLLLLAAGVALVTGTARVTRKR